MKNYMINRKVIRIWLAEHDMTQKELAEKMGVSANGLSHALVNGSNSRMDLVLNLSDATGLDVRELVEEWPGTEATR